MFEKKIFSSRLLDLRIQQGITQQELANAVGLKKSAISMIERGERAASIEIICALADHLSVSIDYLTGRTDNPEINR